MARLQNRSRLGRRLSALAVSAAALACCCGAAASAGAATNPGTGDTGFFTFPVSSPDGSVKVNVASGNLLVDAVDLADAEATYHVTLKRFYNSLAPSADGILGPRWTLHVDPKVQIIDLGATAVIAGPSGYRITATKDAEDNYVLPADFNGQLTKTTTGWTLGRMSEDDNFVFDGSGNLTGTTDSADRVFTAQTTSAGGKTVLSSYGDQNGRRLNLSYNGDSHVREINDPASGRHLYDYTASPGRLASKTGAGTGLGTYAYDAAGYLNRVEQPTGDVVETVNDSEGRVTSFTVTPSGGTAQTTTFDYGVAGQTTITNPDSSTQVYVYDDDWRVVGAGLRDGVVHVGDRLYRMDDTNGDGKVDVAMVDRVTGDVAVALGKGDGTFTAEASRGTFGTAVSHLAVGDLDGDGNNDFVVRTDAGAVKSLLSTGDATYAPGEAEAGALQEAWPAARSFEMTQGGVDRISDLWGVDSTTNQLFVAEGSELGPLDGETRSTIPTDRITVFADLNGDGFDDFVTYDPTTGIVRIHEYDNGEYAAAQTWGTGPSDAEVAAGDVNGDGFDDLVFRLDGGSTPDRIVVRESSVSGGFLSGTKPIGALSAAFALAAHDVDGNGSEDAIGTRVQDGDLLIRSVASALPDPDEPDPRAIDPDDDAPLARSLPTTPVLMGQADTELLWRRNIGLGEGDAQVSFADPTLDATAAASVEQQMKQMRHVGITRLRVIVYWGMVDRLHPSLRSAVQPAAGEGPNDAIVPGMDAVPGVTSNSVFADRSFSGTARRIKNRWMLEPWKRFIKAANASGMKVHLTVTGGVAASFTECSRYLPIAQYDAKPRGCYGSDTAAGNGTKPSWAVHNPSMYRPTGFNTEPDEFRTFVAETVRALRTAPGGSSIESVGLWNEPNLQTNGKGRPNSFLAITERSGLRVNPKHSVTASNGQPKEVPMTIENSAGQVATRPLVNTAVRYGKLYAAGYHGLDDEGATADGVSAAFGELTSGPTLHSKAGSKKLQTVYPGPWTRQALVAAKAEWDERDLPGSVPVVDALAVHPYQHERAPWKLDPRYTFGLSGLSRTTSAGSVKIGALQLLRQAAADNLIATSAGASGNRPPIWGTEFGYWSSQPGKKQTGQDAVKQGKKVHTEDERYLWTRFSGSRKKNQGGALQQVFKDARARRLNFFGTFETVPNHRTDDTSEDYGIIGSGPTPARNNGDNGFVYPTAALGDVRGLRPYAKAGSRLAAGAQRKVACMLRKFAQDEGVTMTNSPYTEASKKCN